MSSGAAPPADAPARAVIDTATLQRLGLAAVGTHAAALAFAHWLLYRQVLGRTLIDLDAPLRTAFAAYTLRVFAAEIAMLVAMTAALAAVRSVMHVRGGTRRLVAAGLASYGAVALYGLAVIAAAAFGWEPDVFVMSAAGATAGQVADAVAEALPLVLQPLPWGRVAATIAGAAVFTLLQIRLCGVSRYQAGLMAAIAASIAAAVQFLVLGVPEAI